MQFFKLLAALTFLHITNSSALQLGQAAKIQELLKEKTSIAAKGYSSNSYSGWLSSLTTYFS